ncbi:PilZ domain-containing protein [Dyella sp. A6]|uniref:PilZ domain-containing protein n=1 Tax=Dyella aluminiiresistens TaxID=3069105 RepID=UPI002E77CDF9|nr:PilZ domain-containing protein [Dyella sp. A6]
MSDEAWQAFSERVAYVDHLPLALLPRDAGLESAAHVEERNLHVLNTLAALEERRNEPADDSNAVMQELQRLDNKLNVLVDIVGRLLSPDADLPPRQALRLNAIGAEIPASLRPDEAGAYFLKIHFDVCRALPLMLPVRFDPIQPSGHGFVTLDVSGQAVQEGLERLVFRQHRRKVAEARHAGI